MSEQIERCDKCKWWTSTCEFEEGRCHRYPPVCVALWGDSQNEPDITNFFFPVSCACDFCGEFAPSAENTTNDHLM